MIQPEFIPLIDEALNACKTGFSCRFVAAYLHGSIEQGDAVKGISDLDMIIIVTKRNDKKDEGWLKTLASGLENQYAHLIEEAHLSIMSEDELIGNRFARFAINYNATLLDGRNVAAQHQLECSDSYEPNKALAKMRLEFAKACFSDALAGQQPACTGKLPQSTYYVSRKFARYFVVIEGAYFLMSKNAFESFRKEAVLSSLYSHADGFSETIDMVRAVLTDPVSAAVDHCRFLKEIQPMVAWMFDQIERA